MRARALDEMAQAHAAVGGTARGRRRATQQINHAYAVLLAAQFQGFCRDLHSECVDHILAVLSPAAAVHQVLQLEMTRGRQLDRGNAHSGSLGADFGRLGPELWVSLRSHDPRTVDWKDDLDLLNEWRNAIVHQDFTSAKLGGIINLQFREVRKLRRSCGRIARALDEVMRRHLQALTGSSPW
jgi:hypothetical protein